MQALKGEAWLPLSCGQMFAGLFWWSVLKFSLLWKEKSRKEYFDWTFKNLTFTILRLQNLTLESSKPPSTADAPAERQAGWYELGKAKLE